MTFLKGILIYVVFGLIGLFILKVIISYFWEKRREQKYWEFYEKNQMVIVQEIPININNAINEKNGIFRKKELIVGGKPFEFFWIETFETVQMINTRQTLYYYYLTVAFLPNTVSQEFMRIAENLQISGTSAKAFLTINTEKPKKVQRLFDGSFTITWQVLNRAEIFQKKIDWLQANLS